MMVRVRTASALFATGLLVSGCSDDGPTGPGSKDDFTSTVRSIVFYNQSMREALAITSDGASEPAVVAPAGMVPLAVGRTGQIAAYVKGNRMLIGSLDNPTTFDTAFAPLPLQMSLAAFSHDERFLALVSFRPAEKLLIYDRADRTIDTLGYGDQPPAMAPAFSPDGRRIALFAATQLSLFLTIVDLDNQGRAVTENLPFSRFVNSPIFGWPVWNETGLNFTILHRGTNAPDTLLAVFLNPDSIFIQPEERFRVPLDSGVTFGLQSSFQYSPDTDAIVLGAQPGDDPGRHALYFFDRGSDSTRTLLNVQGTFPVLPQIIR